MTISTCPQELGLQQVYCLRGLRCVNLPGLKSTISLSRVNSLSLMLSTLRGTTSFCSVTEATLATPELGLVGRITFPVLPSSSMSVCVCVCVCKFFIRVGYTHIFATLCILVKIICRQY